MVEVVAVAEEVAEPEAVEEVVEAVAVTEEIVELEEAAPIKRRKELVSQLKEKPRDYDARLELARLCREERDWDAAMTQYEKLISARKFLPLVIDELKPLSEEAVDDRSRLYQLLGDAYMQNDQLEEALDMYKAARQALSLR